MVAQYTSRAVFCMSHIERGESSFKLSMRLGLFYNSLARICATLNLNSAEQEDQIYRSVTSGLYLVIGRDYLDQAGSKNAEVWTAGCLSSIVYLWAFFNGKWEMTRWVHLFRTNDGFAVFLSDMGICSVEEVSRVITAVLAIIIARFPHWKP